ncbi:MAG: magnesium transporter MgtE [Chloroflexi bacterium HGW-Chloroflexi-4]|jgi:CBS domain-containing protein/sporulation protein YlmC with PRC-barrel domain|nr:MAG: magnesium transporter MgtE [Chloroflexi bacterium HGW-Chloroflexi-4]
MPFISQLIGRVVVDSEGKTLGHLDEVLAILKPEFPHPQLTSLSVINKTEKTVYPFSEVTVLFASEISLAHPQNLLHTHLINDNEIKLIDDVLDKQIIDTNGIRVVRVNDLEITKVNGHYYVSNVDIGSTGILRRIGMTKLAEQINKMFSRDASKNKISWDFVELLVHDQFMHLKVPGEKIRDLHPADLAELLSDMNHKEGRKLLDSMDIEHLADALEEVEPEFQATLVQEMSDERVADVLEEMSPDEAADLLAELPAERSEDLLELMEDEEANDVRMLLSYPEDTAGGIMTTDFASIRPGLTAAKAIEAIRAQEPDAESIFYIYVTDEQDHLLGVFSLSDLVLAKPGTLVSSFMHQKVVSADVLTKQETLAQLIAKYNLLTIPIVDQENRLVGMVTADDALDKIIPTAWKKKLPRFYYYNRA